MGSSSRRWRRVWVLHAFLISCTFFTGVGLLILTLRSIDDITANAIHDQLLFNNSGSSFIINHPADDVPINNNNNNTQARSTVGCATVEEMGHQIFRGHDQSLRLRNIIRRHFQLNGASRVRDLAPEEFCKHGYVIGKASEAGFGNEMYKILTAAALSIMLNRSLIVGQTRHIGASILLETTYLIVMFHLP